MPLPLLVWGAVGLAGLLGIGAHESAKETNEKAERRADGAKLKFTNAKGALERAHSDMESSLAKFGATKKNILESSMREFLDAYKRLRITEFEISPDEKFDIKPDEILKIQKMTNIYQDSFQAATGGAITVTLVSLAATGSLGALTTAGGALLTGSFVTAATTLTGVFAATPIGALLGPVALFTGAFADMRADENLEKANAMYAQAELAEAKMLTQRDLCDAIRERANMLDNLLYELNRLFAPTAANFNSMLRIRDGYFSGRKFSPREFSSQEHKFIASTRALAGAVKAVMFDVKIANDSSDGKSVKLNENFSSQYYELIELAEKYLH